MKIEQVDIELLTPDPNNARKHDQKNLSAIRGSIKQFDVVEPLIVRQSNNVVIGGNGRLAVLKELGHKIVPVHYVDFDDQKSKALALALNRTAELADWDNDILVEQLRDLKIDIDVGEIGFDVNDFNLDLPVEGNTDPDEVPENVETRCKLGDLWVLGNHRVLCGDSTDVLQVERLMGGERADLWLTDPPYGVSYADKNEFLNSLSNGIRLTKRIENDHLSMDELPKFWQAAATNAHLVCKEKSSYYWFACQGGNQMMMMMSIANANWKVRHELIWVKNNHVMGRCDYQYKHEPILYGWKTKGSHEFFGCFQTSVLEFDRPHSSKLHPTMKPVELIETLVNNSSKSGFIVLDTFLGSGSTLIACEKTNRKCYGMEIDPHYCSVILERWENFTGNKAVLS